MSVAKGNMILATYEIRPVDSQQNKQLKCFFPETKESILCIPMELPICLWPSWKETKFLPWTMFVLLILNKTKGWNTFFPKPNHQYRVSQWELPICLCPSRKESWFSPRTKFVPLISKKQRLKWLLNQINSWLVRIGHLLRPERWQFFIHLTQWESMFVTNLPPFSPPSTIQKLPCEYLWWGGQHRVAFHAIRLYNLRQPFVNDQSILLVNVRPSCLWNRIWHLRWKCRWW